ncbi:MAG: hypothetical protein AAF202_11860, partial [Pseudomonadota bacterium]
PTEIAFGESERAQLMRLAYQNELLSHLFPAQTGEIVDSAFQRPVIFIDKDPRYPRYFLDQLAEQYVRTGQNLVYVRATKETPQKPSQWRIASAVGSWVNRLRGREIPKEDPLHRVQLQVNRRSETFNGLNKEHLLSVLRLFMGDRPDNYESSATIFLDVPLASLDEYTFSRILEFAIGQRQRGNKLAIVLSADELRELHARGGGPAILDRFFVGALEQLLQSSEESQDEQ